MVSLVKIYTNRFGKRFVLMVRQNALSTVLECNMASLNESSYAEVFDL